MTLADGIRMFERMHVLHYHATWTYAMAAGSMRSVGSGLFSGANVAVFSMDVPKEALGAWVRRRAAVGDCFFDWLLLMINLID